MLTFRRFTMIFFMFLLGFNLAGIFGCGMEETFFCRNLSWFYLGLVVAYLGVSVLMAFLPCSGFHYPVICSGRTKEHVVSITFDDGPDPAHTPIVLDILKKHRVPAAFFLVGKKIAEYGELVRRIHAEGHITGTHSWSHSKWFDFYPHKKMRRELVMTNEAHKQETGRIPLMFRPPYGVMNPMLARALSKLSLTATGWNIRSYDTMQSDPQRVLERILKRLKPGAVILLHDHSPFCSGHLGTLINHIDKAGYRIIPLNELINLKAYAD